MGKAQPGLDEGPYRSGLVGHAHTAAGQDKGPSWAGVPLIRRTIRFVSYLVHTFFSLKLHARDAVQ